MQAHQMSINGKRDDFTVDDLRAVARLGGLKRGRGDVILSQVVDVVAQWPGIADGLGIDAAIRAAVRATHRLALPRA